MTEADIKYGDVVLVPFGLDNDIAGTVQEVYGPPARRHVVVLLTPDLSSSVVSEPTTISIPLSDLKQPVGT